MATILVIDDDEVVRMALTHWLNADGHHALAAADGVEGLARLRETAVDLVITDIYMPNKEGLGTIMELRRQAPTSRIIAMTSAGPHASFDALRVAQALGAHKTLRKPLDAEALRQAIEDVLSV